MLLIGTLSVCDMLKMFIKNIKRNGPLSVVEVVEGSAAVNGAYQ